MLRILEKLWTKRHGSPRRRKSRPANGSAAARRRMSAPRFFEMLEERQLLSSVSALPSPSVSVVTQQFMTVPFTASGTATVATLAGSLSLTGKMTYASATGGAFTASGPFNSSQYYSEGLRISTSVSGQMEANEATGPDVPDEAISDTTLKYSSNTSQVPSGSYSNLSGTFDTDTFGMTIDGTSTTWSSTVVPTASGSFGIVSKSAVLNANSTSTNEEVDFTFQVTGKPVKTTDGNPQVTTIGVYWANSPNPTDPTSGGLVGSIPVDWNQAGGTDTVTGINTSALPDGATYLLFVANPQHQVQSQSSVFAFPLSSPQVSVNAQTINKSKPTLTGTASQPLLSGNGIKGVTVVVSGPTLTLPEKLTATVNATTKTWSVTSSQSLPDGTYTVQATATDTVGNTATASNTLIVDTHAPAVTVNTLVTHDKTPTLTGTVSDASPSSGIAGVTVVVDKQTVQTVVSTRTVDPTTGTISATWKAPLTTVVADGTYSVQVTAKDAAGNSTVDTVSKGLTVDTVAPKVTINPLVTKNNLPTLTGTVSDPSPSSGIKGVTVVIDGQSLTATISGSTWSVKLVKVPDGTYNVTATAADNAGNTTTITATGGLIVDTVAPTVTVNPLLTNKSKPTLTGTVSDQGPSSGIAAVTVVVNGQTVKATLSTTVNPVTGTISGTWSAVLTTALASGTYNVQVTATDKAGNSTVYTASKALTVDTVSPKLTVNKLVTYYTYYTAYNMPTLTGTVSDPSPGSGIKGVTVVIDGQSLTATISGNTWSVPLGSVPAGTYNVTATATDNAGNTTVVTVTGLTLLTVDVTPPLLVEVNPLTTSNSKPTLTGFVEVLGQTSGIVTASVTVAVDGQTVQATVSKNVIIAGGNTTAPWSAVLTKALAVGTYDVTMTVTGKNGGYIVIDSGALTVT